MKHYYSEILVAIAEGKDIQYLEFIDWSILPHHQVLRLIIDDVNPKFLRIKPETIKINGITITTPESKPLKLGQTYFAVTLDHESEYHYWTNDTLSNFHLRSGLIHLSKENARVHKEALLSFNRTVCGI